MLTPPTAVIQEAKVLLATQSLRAAMERRDVAELRAAIVAAEGEAEVDVALVEVGVSGRGVWDVSHVYSTISDTQHHDLPPNWVTNLSLNIYLELPATNFTAVQRWYLPHTNC